MLREDDRAPGQRTGPARRARRASGGRTWRSTGSGCRASSARASAKAQYWSNRSCSGASARGTRSCLQELGAAALPLVLLLDVGDEQAGEDADAGAQDGDLGRQRGEGRDQRHGEGAGQGGADELEAQEDGSCSGIMAWVRHSAECTTEAIRRASRGGAASSDRLTHLVPTRAVWSVAQACAGPMVGLTATASQWRARHRYEYVRAVAGDRSLARLASETSRPWSHKRLYVRSVRRKPYHFLPWAPKIGPCLLLCPTTNGWPKVSGLIFRQQAPKSGAGGPLFPGRRLPGLASAARPCYDRSMRAFVCEVDQTGLRRLVPEDLVPGDELGRLVRPRVSRPTTLVWALLHDRDAEAIRAELTAGGHADACGLLLNRAVELLTLGPVMPDNNPATR